jgi:hypothetical protein
MMELGEMETGMDHININENGGYGWLCTKTYIQR